MSACGAPSSGLAVAGHFAADPTSSQYSLALHNADNRAVPNGVAECKCFSPFYFDVSDARIGELLWDVAVKASIPRIQVGVSPGSTAAPLNARASFLAICSTALTRLGCPIASQSVDASSTTAPWVCECAGYTTGDHRASEGLIDNLVSVLNTPSVPATTPNFVCGTAPDRYQSLCSVTLLALGCYSTVPVGSPKGGALWTVRVLPSGNRRCFAALPICACCCFADGTNYTGGGCATPGDLTSFSQGCTCQSPFYLDTPSNRVQELLVDSRLKANASLVLKARTNTATGVVDFRGAYLDACLSTLAGLGCPAAMRSAAYGAVPVSQSLPMASTQAWLAANSYLTCTCGAFDTSGRVAEVLFDAILQPFTAVRSEERRLDGCFTRLASLLALCSLSLPR